MTLVVQKAAKKPSYVDAKVPETDLRRMHSISARNEPNFSRAFLALADGLAVQYESDEFLQAIREAKRFQISIEDAIDVITWYDPIDPSSVALWERLSVKLDNAYRSTMIDAGEGEIRSKGWNFKYTIAKVEEPPNPYSSRFVNMKLDEVTSNLSNQQKELVRRILEDGISNGLHATEIREKILQVAGLTDRDAAAVQRRIETMENAGVPPSSVASFAQDYSRKLLIHRAKMISRTEVIQSYNQGLQDTWLLAQEQGIVVPEAKKEWVEVTLSKKTCKICRDLGRQQVPLNENFWSDVLGQAVEKPPAHPHCRCTMIIVQPDT